MSISVLALSSSRTGNSSYLGTAGPLIAAFLHNRPANVAFIPFASVDNDYVAYATKVREGLHDLPYTIRVVEPDNAKQIIEQSDVIMVGGGNTFKLLHDLYELDLINIIQDKVNTGTPYIGWSAGANITGLTIGTTNDMPIIEPKSFKSLAFFPFQLNPHYINVKPDGHNGETRDERLNEFIKMNFRVPIVGLPEGTALQLRDEKLTLIGGQGVLFQFKSEIPVKEEILANSDLSYLLER